MSESIIPPNWSRTGEQHTWGNVIYTWSGIQFVWSDVPLIAALDGGGRRSDYRKRYQKLEEKKKKRVIELICQINGIKYNQKREVKDYKVTVEDIKQLIEEFNKVKLSLKVHDV